MSAIELDGHMGGQSPPSATAATPPIITAYERWALLTQELQFNRLQFNRPNVSRVSPEQAPGEDDLRFLVEAADRLPGDMDMPDAPEIQAERSAVAEALIDDQMRLIAGDEE
jgi:hypothetical protein